MSKEDTFKQPERPYDFKVTSGDSIYTMWFSGSTEDGALLFIYHSSGFKTAGHEASQYKYIDGRLWFRHRSNDTTWDALNHFSIIKEQELIAGIQAWLDSLNDILLGDI